MGLTFPPYSGHNPSSKNDIEMIPVPIKNICISHEEVDRELIQPKLWMNFNYICNI